MHNNIPQYPDDSTGIGVALFVTMEIEKQLRLQLSAPVMKPLH